MYSNTKRDSTETSSLRVVGVIIAEKRGKLLRFKCTMSIVFLMLKSSIITRPSQHAALPVLPVRPSVRPSVCRSSMDS